MRQRAPLPAQTPKRCCKEPAHWAKHTLPKTVLRWYNASVGVGFARMFGRGGNRLEQRAAGTSPGLEPSSSAAVPRRPIKVTNSPSAGRGESPLLFPLQARCPAECLYFFEPPSPPRVLVRPSKLRFRLHQNHAHTPRLRRTRAEPRSFVELVSFCKLLLGVAICSWVSVLMALIDFVFVSLQNPI